MTGCARRSVLLEGSLLLTFSQLPLITLQKLHRKRKQRGTRRHSFLSHQLSPLGRSSWGRLLSTSSTTEQHPWHVSFPFCFVCACLCLHGLYVCALHKRDTSVSAQVRTQIRTQRRRGGLSACHLIALRRDLSFTGPEGSIQLGSLATEL